MKRHGNTLNFFFIFQGYGILKAVINLKSSRFLLSETMEGLENAIDDQVHAHEQEARCGPVPPTIS